MAKKTRRPRRSQQPRTYAQTGSGTTTPTAVPAAPKAKASEPAPSAPKADAGKSSGQVDFASEYRYVIRDLTRTFVVAGFLLVFLIVLNFIVQ